LLDAVPTNGRLLVLPERERTEPAE
jgi:hypothetical protein